MTIKPQKQDHLFDGDVSFHKGLTQGNIVKTVSYSQSEILSWIIKLYCPRGFQLDATYSKGNFYKLIPQPKIKTDLEAAPGVIPADVRALPFKTSSLETSIFDPPFLGASPVKPSRPGSNIIPNRFGKYRTFPELWKMYREALSEFYRVLNPAGILVVKCQDGINDHKQYLSHVEIINYGLSVGFYVKDFFILLSRNILIGAWQNQEHARKAHSYFIVFSKKGRKINYFGIHP